MKQTDFALLLLAQVLTSQSFAQTLNLCDHTEVIAHRGIPGLAPEESSIGYLLAADLKVDYLEMDVQRTEDGTLILNHDGDFARTTNIKSVFPAREKSAIKNFNFSDVESLNTGLVFNESHKDLAHAKFKDAKIIRLEDVIDLALSHSNHPGLYIESKDPKNYPGIESEIVNLLLRKNAFGKLKITFQSFDRESIVQFTKLAPGIPAVLLTDAYFYKTLTHSDLNFAKRNGLGLGPKLSTVGLKRLASFLKLAHQANVFVHFYTVDSPNDLSELIRNQADGIFTNRADLAEIACLRLSPAETVASIHERLDL